MIAATQARTRLYKAMNWCTDGILISLRRHCEGAAIIEVFTSEHGRQAGLVRGGGSRRSRDPRWRNFDPGLWVIEAEDRQARSLLDEPCLSG